VSEHDRVKDLLAAVALGAATREEAERASIHADECAVCREELDGLLAASAALALEVPQREPPPDLRERVMTAVRAEPRGAERPPAPAPRRRFLPALVPGRAWAPVAAVLAAAVIGLVVWNVVLQSGSEGERVTAIAVRGGPSAPGVRGQVLVLRDRGAAVVRLEDLPPAGRGRAYELWAIRDGRPVSAGFMAPEGRGSAVAAAGDLSGVSALAVTPEPTGNTSAPTGPRVVVAPLPV
jgi:Anti-sigma-K factor rskA, C-terminal